MNSNASAARHRDGDRPHEVRRANGPLPAEGATWWCAACRALHGGSQAALPSSLFAALVALAASKHNPRARPVANDRTTCGSGLTNNWVGNDDSGRGRCTRIRPSKGLIQTSLIRGAEQSGTQSDAHSGSHSRDSSGSGSSSQSRICATIQAALASQKASNNN